MFRDFTGARFGKLTAVKAIGRIGNDIIWKCICDCGKERLLSRNTMTKAKSCGCFRVIPKHGHCIGQKSSREYESWANMMQRCCNTANKSFPRYGGRGIKVCDRWKDFANFVQDMGKRPKGCSLNRKNNNGIYEPSNCEWASDLAQANNRSNNHVITHNGVSKTLKEWERELGLPFNLISNRLFRGYTESEALFTPYGKRKPYGRHR